MTFRQVYGFVLFLPIYMAGKAWLFLHGNLLILLLNRKKCWPPVTDAHIRTKILLWYIKNIVPIYKVCLMMNRLIYSSLTLLEDSLILLAELEYNLLSGERTIISEMLHEVKRQKNSNHEKSDDYFMEEGRHEGLNETCRTCVL